MTGSPPKDPANLATNRHGLMGGVVDIWSRQLHAPPIRRAIEDEVRGPDLVAYATGRTSGCQLRSPLSRIFLRRRRFTLEPGLRVATGRWTAFVIDDVAGLPQLQIDHPGCR